MESTFLTFDIGTTAVKVCLFGDDGSLVASIAEEYTLLTPARDHVEIDPRVYWSSVVNATQVIMRERRDRDGGMPTGVGVCSQGETLVFLDNDGEPARNSIVWMDNRATAESAQIAKDLGINRETGMPGVEPMWSASKLLWVRKHEPEVFRRVRSIMLVQDYILHHLTGRCVSDHSLVPTTYMYDIYSKVWWSEMLSYLAIDPELLPEVEPPGVQVGTVRTSAALQLNLPAGLPVVACGMDQTAAMVGAGNVFPGTVSVTTGAALALCTTIGTDQVSRIRECTQGPASELPVQPHIVPDAYLCTQWCQSGGMSFRWLRDNLYTLLDPSGVGPGTDSYRELTSAAATVPPGSEGLIFLPYMAGSGTVPIPDDVRGVFWGLGLHHTRAHMTRSVMEAIAFLVRLLIEQLQTAGVACDTLRLLGGGAQSPLWRQMKANVTGRVVVAPLCPEVTSLGVAMQVAAATGHYRNVVVASEAMSGHASETIPEPERVREYDAAYSAFRDLHQRLLRE